MKVGRRNSKGRFGDVALLVFLVAQALDGVLTYVGVSVYGSRMEGNPILGWLMSAIGQGPALAAPGPGRSHRGGTRRSAPTAG